LTTINHAHGNRGFSLIDVTIATGVMASALVALGQMLAISVSNNRTARTLTYATVLAEQKMEQLRGLAWGFDSTGASVTDSTTNTAAPLDGANGGTGLSRSPADTIAQSIDGWVDYVDQFGAALGGGVLPPPNTLYIRRWAIEPLPADPANTIVIHVLVTPHVNRGLAGAALNRRLPLEARLVSVKTRKAP